MTRKQSIFSAVVLLVIISTSTVLFLHNAPDGKLLLAIVQWKNDVFEQTRDNNQGAFLVKRVVDGDTIELDNGEKVRYIGINTPESVDPRRPVECFGKEASAYNKELVEGKKVRLERNISERDKYGRLLRFVYLEDGVMVNEVLVRDGYAFVATYPPDVAKQGIFREEEQSARNEKKGLWSEATCNGKK